MFKIDVFGFRWGAPINFIADKGVPVVLERAFREILKKVFYRKRFRIQPERIVEKLKEYISHKHIEV